MALSLICPDKDPQPWIKALKRLDPKLSIRVWPEDGPRKDIELALTWSHPPGCLNQYPNLGCISSMGAGVDHLLSDPDLPPNVPIVRVVDKNLVKDMAEYICLCVLLFFRQFDRFQAGQEKGLWQPLPPLDKEEFPVGIMGLGQLGKAAAESLKQMGFPVSGWKNSPGSAPGMDIYHGKEQLSKFLEKSRILICLLPLTDTTRGILNRSLFSGLPPKSYLINAARGGHLIEEDLIRALDRGRLSGAVLDVFETEPLPGDHPFWHHPKIRITPHVSSLTRPGSVAPQIMENLNRLRTGRPLLNPVTPEKGY